MFAIDSKTECVRLCFFIFKGVEEARVFQARASGGVD